MKKKTIIAIVLAFGLLASLLCGCSQSGEKARTPEEVVQAATEKLQKADSVKYEMDMDISMKVSSGSINQTLDMVTESDLLCYQEPLMMKMEMNMDMGAFGSVKTLVYGQEVENNQLEVYTSVDDGKTFTTQTMDMSEAKQYNANENIQQYLTGITEVKDAGEETIDEKTVSHYDAIITGEDIRGAMEASGVLDQLGQAGMNGENIDISKLLDEVGPLKVSLWIDTETDDIMRYSIDMTEFMNSFMSSLMSQMGAGAENISFSVEKTIVELHDIDLAPDEKVVIPEEALAGSAGTETDAGVTEDAIAAEENAAAAVEDAAAAVEDASDAPVSGADVSEAPAVG